MAVYKKTYRPYDGALTSSWGRFLVIPRYAFEDMQRSRFLTIFYIASFVAVRGLLGWATVDRLPVAFKLLQARIVEPHSLEGDPGSIYLWVETLDEGNRPSGVPRAYRLPYRDALAEKTDKAISEIAAGRAQGGRAADLGSGQGGLMEAVREYITPNTIMETSGGDPSPGGGVMAAPRAGDEVSFTPLLPPRMPPKDVQ